MNDLQILTAVKNKGGSIEFIDLLNCNLTDKNRDVLADQARIARLIERNLLSGKPDAHQMITITDNGRIALQDAEYLQEDKDKLAKESANAIAKQQRHEWKVSFTSAIIAAAVGLVIEIIKLVLS